MTDPLVPVFDSQVPKWFNKDLSVMRKNFLSSNSSRSDKKKARNRYVSAVRKAKRNFTREAVNQQKGGVWKILKTHKPMDFSSFFKDSSLKNEQDLAEAFSSFFRNKVDSLKVSPDASNIFDQMKEKFGHFPKWDIHSCSKEDVAKAIDGLKPSKSYGPDLISNLLIKQLKFEALDALTLVFNRCISEGTFPDIWKTAKIVPIHKKGARNKLENYRPVCLFSNLGKLLTKVVVWSPRLNDQLSGLVEILVANNQGLVQFNEI